MSDLTDLPTMINVYTCACVTPIQCGHKVCQPVWIGRVNVIPDALKDKKVAFVTNTGKFVVPYRHVKELKLIGAQCDKYLEELHTKHDDDDEDDEDDEDEDQQVAFVVDVPPTIADEDFKLVLDFLGHHYATPFVDVLAGTDKVVETSNFDELVSNPVYQVSLAFGCVTVWLFGCLVVWLLDKIALFEI